MSRFKLIVEYDGTPFCGWQRQNASPSVQGHIEAALLKLTGQTVTLMAAGRTDAGVHARGQVIHIDLIRSLQPHQLQQGLNALLRPLPISITYVTPVADDFHARFSASMRHYQYLIINRPGELALDQHRAWLIYKPLNLEKMTQAASYFLGTHDFTSFRATECQAQNPIKTLSTLSIWKSGDNIYIDVSSRSFLHHQVRNMVGTLKWVGEGKTQPSDISAIFTARDRRKAGPTAPACGLTFMHVDY